MAAVFVSYRRQDKSAVTDRVYDWLEEAFGRTSVFRDIDSIPVGSDFRSVIFREIGRCRVMLAIVGENWLLARDGAGARRIDNPDDYVRIELEMAISRKIPLIPVLIEGARMPKAEDIPEAIRHLAFCNAVEIRPDPDFRRDVAKLIASLESLGVRRSGSRKTVEERERGWAAFKSLLVGFTVLAFVIGWNLGRHPEWDGTFASFMKGSLLFSGVWTDLFQAVPGASDGGLIGGLVGGSVYAVLSVVILSATYFVVEFRKQSQDAPKRYWFRYRITDKSKQLNGMRLVQVMYGIFDGECLTHEGTIWIAEEGIDLITSFRTSSAGYEDYDFEVFSEGGERHMLARHIKAKA